MAATNTFANNLLNRWLRNTTYPSKPTTIYFGLLKAPPASSVGTGFTEVSTSGTGYTRSAIAVNNSTNFVVGTGGGGNGIDTNRITNGVEILFNRSTADWGTITHIGIFSGATGNNLLAWFEMPGGAMAVGSSTRFRFEVNKLDIGFDATIWGDTLMLAWLNHFFRNETWSLSSGNVWMALCNATSSSGITEITATGGYTRGGGSSNVATTADDGFALTTVFSAATNGESFNASSLCMPTSTGPWESGAPIPRLAFMSAFTGGNVLAHGPLSSGGVIVSASAIGLTFSTGDGNGMKFTLTN